MSPRLANTTGREVTMLKAGMIAAIVLATFGGAVRTLMWSTSEPRRETPAVLVSMPSIEELHAKAHATHLQDQTVKDPY
jgi:hypothetical protein